MLLICGGIHVLRKVHVARVSQAGRRRKGNGMTVQPRVGVQQVSCKAKDSS